jgi:O-antigen/teichoic acid export membrane protein
MSDESLVEQIARGFKASLVANVASVATKGVLLIALTRYLLTPDEFGLLFYAMSVLSVGHLLATLGFAKSTARYVAEFMETDESQVRYILRVGLQYNLFSIGLVSVGLVVLHEHIAALLNEPKLAPFLLLGPVYIAFKSLRVFLRLVFQGFNRVEWSAFVSIAVSVCQLISVVGLVLLGYGVVGAFLGYGIAYGIASLLGFIVLYRKFYSQLEPAESVRTDLRRRVLEYNFPLAWTRGAGILDGRVDSILVGFFLNPTAVGFYMLGKQITQFVTTPATALGFVVSPTFGTQKASDNLDRASEIYRRSIENILLLYLPAAAGIILVAEPAIRLVFGKAYLGAVPVLQVLSIYVILRSIDNLTNDSLDYLGRARERAIMKSVGSVSNFLLNIALIPAIGVVGAAAATVITNGVVIGMNVYFIHQELDLPVGSLGVTALQVGAVTAVMAGIVWWARSFVSGIPSLVGVIAIGVFVWAVLAVASGLVDRGELRTALAN